MTSASHTPLPWGLSQGYSLAGNDWHPAQYVAGPNPKAIGIKLATPWIEGAWDNDPEAEANARFIVRACNSHYELLEALETIRNLWAGHAEECAYVQDYENKCDCDWLKIAAKCDAALRLARGEQP